MYKIEFVSGAGGVGKSTLAMAVASYWHNDGAKVAIYDADESMQITDAVDGKDVGFDIVHYEPKDGYDILIIDNAPGTTTPTHHPDIVVYPMLPHGKSLKALKRTAKMLGDKVVFIASRVSSTSIDKESAAIIKSIYGGAEIRQLEVYKSIMHLGDNFFNLKRNNAWYRAKNDIALLAQKIEGLM